MESKGKGIFKRALPFIGTFALGLFIASFFVDISAPRFRGHRAKRHDEMQRLRTEVKQLREENSRLRNEWETHDYLSHEGGIGDFDPEKHWTDSRVPFVPPPAPVAPSAR